MKQVLTAVKINNIVGSGGAVVTHLLPTFDIGV